MPNQNDLVKRIEEIKEEFVRMTGKPVKKVAYGKNVPQMLGQPDIIPNGFLGIPEWRQDAIEAESFIVLNEEQ